MRIAIVTQNYRHGGGVTTTAHWLRQGLVRAGHEVVVHSLASSSRDPHSGRMLAPASLFRSIGPYPDSDDEGLIDWGAHLVELESQRYRPRRPLTASLDTFDAIQVIAGAPALGLSVTSCAPPKVLLFATTLGTERPSQLPGMGPVKRQVKSSSLRRLLRIENRALRAMDHVMVINRPMERWARESGQSHVSFTPPGIDVDRFTPKALWSAARPVVAFGRLGDSRKDWPSAVAAYERYLGLGGVDHGLIIAGKGPVTPALERRIADSHLRASIRIAEDISPEDLPRLLADGSVFLQSSLEEGLGLAGIEAMASGLPVVATATVGSREYVRDGINGCLVEVGNDSVPGLAQGLFRVLEEGEGEQMSAAAIRTARDEYSTAVTISRFIEVYKGLGG